MNRMKRIISAALIIGLISNWSGIAQAQLGPTAQSTMAREYFVGRDLGRPLITVHLLNGVSLPGVYHVPAGTDVAELIAFAGGATAQSDLSGVLVRRPEGRSYKIVEMNLEKSLRDTNDLLRVQDRDVIQIDQKFQAERTLTWVSIVSATATVILTVFMVQDIQRRKSD